MRIGVCTSPTVITNTDTPWALCSAPILFSLFTNDCAAISTNLIVKFSDDTIIVGPITDNDESAYREEVGTLTAWCQDNNFTA